MKENNKEIIKNINDLTKDELKQYKNRDNKNILFHHKNFKGLNIIDLYDCKDTNMKLEDYKHYDLPVLFYTDINDIYNSFVKAIYSSGYKVKYCEMDPKFSFDEETNTINIKNGLNNNIKIKAMLDVYTSLNSSNNFEKGLLNYAICKGIGIDDDFMDKNDLTDWYKKTNIKDVDKTLKLLSSKGKKFIDKVNKFYELESKNYEYENVSLYDDFKISI